MAPITVVIPAFNRQDLTTHAVEQFREQSMPPDEIIVVDDGSNPPIAVKGALIIRHPVNLGFAAAVNAGIRACRTPLVAILNNDVTLQPEWIERLAGEFKNPDVQFACGKLYRPDGLLDGTWDLICRGGLPWRAGSGRPDGPLWSRRRQIAMTSFTAVVVRTALFAEAGPLDESYGSYYEDVEWSLRCALTGKRGIFQPAATGVHLGSATAGPYSGYSSRQLLRNHRRLVRQYLLPRFRTEARCAAILLRLHVLRKGRWPTMAAEDVVAKPFSAELASVLGDSEEELYDLQRQTGMDLLWRVYFQLAGGSR